MEKQNYNIEDIILRHLLKEASIEEENLLLSWLKSDVQNQKEYFRMKEVWFASQNENPAIHKTDESWNALKAAALKKDRMVSLPGRHIFRQVLKYAALFVAIIGIGFFAFKYGSGIFKKEIPVTFTEVQTPDGQKKEITLPDGSTIWINSGSTFRYASNFGEKNREVYLEGEAYFDVARDTTKTFIVHADKITIKVLGTSFNVKCYPELKTIETTVISGTVSLENAETEEGMNKEIVILNKKEKATFLRNQQKMYITKNKTREEENEVEPIQLRKITLNEEESGYIASWKDQVLSFNNESFEEMAHKLQRWYNVKIIIQDEKLKNYRYKGKFDHIKSIFQVLEVVKLTTPISYEYDEKNKEITIKESKAN